MPLDDGCSQTAVPRYKHAPDHTTFSHLKQIGIEVNGQHLNLGRAHCVPLVNQIAGHRPPPPGT